MIGNRKSGQVSMKNMVLLIDANVVLSYITRRQPGFDEAYRLMDLCSGDNVDGYIAFHTVSIVWYALRKKPQAERREVLLNLCSVLTVAGASHKDVVEAIKHEEFSDFEDCLQEKCAENIHADYIVTENLRDFKVSNVMAISPRGMLDVLGDKLIK